MTDVQTNPTKEDAASKRLQQDDSTFRTVPVNATISRSGSFVEIPTCQHVINRVWPINEHLLLRYQLVLSGFVSLYANNPWAKYKIPDRIALDDITYDKLMKCDPFSFPAPFALVTMPNVGPNGMTSPRY
ncbi:hypothetical protein V1478_016063 [Vespula squamosa]|uniref:Uncharacterized protein n=1 Tax=Vespula squamosa TaxID=30214 RepID=A0ABD2A2P9_VESSQ